jgi:hypothetical protein
MYSADYRRRPDWPHFNSASLLIGEPSPACARNNPFQLQHASCASAHTQAPRQAHTSRWNGRKAHSGTALMQRGPIPGARPAPCCWISSRGGGRTAHGHNAVAAFAAGGRACSPRIFGIGAVPGTTSIAGRAQGCQAGDRVDVVRSPLGGCDAADAPEFICC